MKPNVGTLDRIFRVLLAIVLVSFAFYGDGAWRGLAVVGVVFLLTGLFSFCPLYRLVGFQTCPKS